MKKTLLILIIIIISVSVFSIDFKYIDDLSLNKKFRESKALLLKDFNRSNPNVSILWRLGRSYYDEADNYDDKNKRIQACDNGMKFLEPYYKISTGDRRDRAEIIYWYAVLSSLKSKTKGIFDSLGNLPNLFRYCDEAIKIDPAFGEPYYLKGMIGEAVPIGKYSDKFIMGENFSKALKFDRDNMWFLVDGAKGFITRNWDKNKKKSMADKYGRDDGTPQYLHDKKYAKQLLNEAINVFENGLDKSIKKREKYEEAKQMLKSL